MSVHELPVPSFFDKDKVGKVWAVPYLTRQDQAETWAKQHGVKPAATDPFRLCVMGIDIQNTFCIPDTDPEFGGQLFVGGRSGTGAVDDNVRLVQWLYRNLGYITEIDPTMDTHRVMQIFHNFFWVGPDGSHPAPMTVITVSDIKNGTWRVNPAVAVSVAGGDYNKLQRHALFYAETLESSGKYPLVVWPYHGMLGGISHALVASFEEACFFHTIARGSQTGFEVKGGNFLTENYSVIGPEVTTTYGGTPIDQKNARFVERLLKFDAVVIAGQAKSHCVAWTISDLLDEIVAKDPELAKKVYLLEDCTSPVVVPGVIDFTDEADQAFSRFASAGMNVVRTDMPLDTWPGIKI